MFDRSAANPAEAAAGPRVAPQSGIGPERRKISAPMPDSLVVTQRGPVTLLRLARPEKRNALDAEMVAGLNAFFSAPPEGTRVVVMHGEGNHFSAGADLSAITGINTAGLVHASRAAHLALDRLEHGGVPVIAVLHGAVVGGGLELAVAAHIRVAEYSTYYALPEGMRGLFVGGGGSVRIPRLIGTARMMDMMLTNRTYSAAQGLSLGFSQYVAEDGHGLDKGIELAERIATNATLSNFALVQALPRIARADPETGFLTESLMAALAASDQEAQTRINAFLQKRAPKALHGSAAAE